MPRCMRLKSSTNIYHVIWRGVARQNIFCEEYDFKKFLWILSDYKKEYGFEVYAYCLMTNHIHLLIKAENISNVMKVLGGKYAQWFNTKYTRIGHLFQDRFLSEPVENEKYLLTVIRYIHQNPIKAFITDRVSEYRWSSFNSYIYQSEIVDTKFILEIISKKQFIEFNNMLTNDCCLDIKESFQKITDEKAVELMKKELGCEALDYFKTLAQDKQSKVIKVLLKNKVSKRQIERFLKCNRRKIDKLLT